MSTDSLTLPGQSAIKLRIWKLSRPQPPTSTVKLSPHVYEFTKGAWLPFQNNKINKKKQADPPAFYPI